MKVSLRFSIMVGVILALATASFAAPLNWSAADRDNGIVRPRTERGGSALDEDYTQLRYLKTTDYGQTWSDFTQAGDMSLVEELTGSPGDFSGIVTATNELCFAIVLDGDLYTFTGPNFAAVMAIDNGANSFDGNGAGWADVCRSPNGDLIAITWGHDSNGANTVWAAKSTDNGGSYGAPWMVLTEPTLSADAQYFHLADMTHADYAFMQFQIPGEDGYDQYVARFPTAGGAGEITSLGAYAGTEVSYYTGNCSPIKYDPENNALYCVHRNLDVSGTAVYYSGDMGMTFSSNTIPGAQRYPSVALNAATQTPWVISNFGVPSEPGEHCSWYSYDEFGYNGGSWTDPTELSCTPFDGGDYYLFYMNQGYWWDADRGVAQLGLWGDFTPDGVNASYTDDGGETWSDNVRLYYFVDDQIDAGTVQNFELAGGSDGVAYIFSSGAHGITDLEGPVVTEQTLDPSTPATTLGPYVISAMLTDNITVDAPEWIQVEWMNATQGETELLGYWGSEGGGGDSCQGCDENNNGRWFFTIPGNHDESDFVHGDTIWFDVWATDPPGNSGYGPLQGIVAGEAYLGVDDPGRPARAADFRLLGNYPNPFNPSTRIEFTVPFDTRISLKIYNTLGQEVAALADNLQIGPGLYAYNFDASDLPSGVYIYRLSSGDFSDAKKMIMVK
jgi:hypothetical protein